MEKANPNIVEYQNVIKQSHSSVYLCYHIVWGTHNRIKITVDMQSALINMIPDICHENDCSVLNIAVLQNHVHLLVKTESTTQLSGLVKTIKGKSSYLIGRTHKSGMENGIWANGYFAESVGNRTVAQIKSYIDKQKEHHSTNEENEVMG